MTSSSTNRSPRGSPEKTTIVGASLRVLRRDGLLETSSRYLLWSIQLPHDGTPSPLPLHMYSSSRLRFSSPMRWRERGATPRDRIPRERKNDESVCFAHAPRSCYRCRCSSTVDYVLLLRCGVKRPDNRMDETVSVSPEVEKRQAGDGLQHLHGLTDYVEMREQKCSCGQCSCA